MKERRKKRRNENNFYLSYVIVCKIIYTRRKFLFHLKLPSSFFSSSVWLSVLLTFPSSSYSTPKIRNKKRLTKDFSFFLFLKTNFLKIFIQPKHRYTRCTFLLLLFYFINIFDDFFFRSFFGYFFYGWERNPRTHGFRYIRRFAWAHAKWMLEKNLIFGLSPS